MKLLQKTKQLFCSKQALCFSESIITRNIIAHFDAMDSQPNSENVHVVLKKSERLDKTTGIVVKNSGFCKGY